jgi:hypothetical protein
MRRKDFMNSWNSGLTLSRYTPVGIVPRFVLGCIEAIKMAAQRAALFSLKERCKMIAQVWQAVYTITPDRGHVRTLRDQLAVCGSRSSLSAVL